MKQEIATILREAADRIASIVEPAPVVPAPPEGYHIPALGPVVKDYALAKRGDIQMWIKGTGKWTHANGDSPHYYYAIRKGSKLAVLNGLETETPAMPEPPEGYHTPILGPVIGWKDFMANGDVQHYADGWCPYAYGNNEGYIYAIRKGSELAVLNGLEPATPPNQEQVDALVTAAREASAYFKEIRTPIDPLDEALKPFAK